MSNPAAENIDSFAYQAQTPEGQTLAGTIDAANVEQAQRTLLGLRLRVTQIEPIRRPPRTKAIGGADFLAFNQQLTHLTRAGLPVEHGLRLIAQDMRTGRLRATVQQVASELESGTPLDQAFEKHRDKFPPLYARLIAAGVASSNLPGVLLSLGRHMEMIYRLRAMLWRVAAYPIMVLVALGLILLFLTKSVIPQFDAIFRDFGTKLPALTEFMLSSRGWMPQLLLGIGVIVLLIPIVWHIAKMAGADRALVDIVILPMPLIGPVLRRNLIARWCDAVRIGVEAGLDLPRAIELASDAVASPRLRRDGDELIGALNSGKTPDAIVGQTRLLPATVPAAMTLAGQNGELPRTLATLSEMYEQQAESRLNLIPGLLTPLLILFVAFLIGIVILSLFAPIISLIQNISSPGGK
ncbi:MAG: type pilus assembly protein PilC [Humisphaera sp.]|nr:type pilus assembly protein PilC [Humisphaera sp.]